MGFTSEWLFLWYKIATLLWQLSIGYVLKMSAVAEKKFPFFTQTFIHSVFIRLHSWFFLYTLVFPIKNTEVVNIIWSRKTSIPACWLKSKNLNTQCTGWSRNTSIPSGLDLGEVKQVEKLQYQCTYWSRKSLKSFFFFYYFLHWKFDDHFPFVIQAKALCMGIG